jgi:hypothetical protein
VIVRGVDPSPIDGRDFVSANRPADHRLDLRRLRRRLRL